jgi:hypothetical protein
MTYTRGAALSEKLEKKLFSVLPEDDRCVAICDPLEVVLDRVMDGEFNDREGIPSIASPRLERPMGRPPHGTILCLGRSVRSSRKRGRGNRPSRSAWCGVSCALSWPQGISTRSPRGSRSLCVLHSPAQVLGVRIAWGLRTPALRAFRAGRPCSSAVPLVPTAALCRFLRTRKRDGNGLWFGSNFDFARSKALQLQGLRMLKLKDVLSGWEAGRLSQLEAAEILGMSERTFRRWSRRFDPTPVSARMCLP